MHLMKDDEKSFKNMLSSITTCSFVKAWFFYFIFKMCKILRIFPLRYKNSTFFLKTISYSHLLMLYFRKYTHFHVKFFCVAAKQHLNEDFCVAGHCTNEKVDDGL